MAPDNIETNEVHYEYIVNRCSNTWHIKYHESHRCKKNVLEKMLNVKNVKNV